MLHAISHPLSVVFATTLALLVALATGATAHAQQLDVDWEVVAEGLNSPRGIHVADTDTIYVAEAGAAGESCYTGPMEEYGGAEFCTGDTASITRIRGGEAVTVSEGLPSIGSEGSFIGPHDVALTDDGEMLVAIGAMGSHEELGRYGRLVRIDGDGAATPHADLLAYERDRNPGAAVIASNAYAIVRSPDGDSIVSDAAMNTLLRVTPSGDVSILAKLEGRIVELPPELREEDGPSEIPMDTVPTGLAIGPEGAYYVGELTGYPFPVGEARIWRISPSGEAETYADGFTNVIDVAFDGSGRLYVLEMLSRGLLQLDPADPATMRGTLVRIEEDGTRTTIASDRLVFPTGLAIGPDDAIYVSNQGAAPGMGEVVRIEVADGG